MGMGVSAHRLVGAVAAQGGVGTLSSVDLRRHHPDLMDRTQGVSSRVGQHADTRAQIDAANRQALAREVHAARTAAAGHGLIALTVMPAIPESLALLRSAGLDGCIPLIAAGGIRSHADIARIQALGGAAVQLGTPFAVTTECDASGGFKRVLAEASDDDLVEFTSLAGLPARAVATPWLLAYLKCLPRLQAVAHAKPRCTKGV